jgi:hypothetical protein
MAEIKFTPEIFEQTDLVQEECRKLQALLDGNVPDTTFIWCLDEDKVSMIPDLFRKEKRIREPIVIIDDNDEDDVEVKLKHSSAFKRDDDEDDEVEELLQNELLENFDPATWGMEPQSPWSQHVEQNHVIVPTTTDQ